MYYYFSCESYHYCCTNIHIVLLYNKLQEYYWLRLSGSIDRTKLTWYRKSKIVYVVLCLLLTYSKNKLYEELISQGNALLLLLLLLATGSDICPLSWVWARKDCIVDEDCPYLFIKYNQNIPYLPNAEQLEYK